MSSSEIVSFNPCTDEVVWRGPAVDHPRLEDMVGTARRAFLEWSDVALNQRREVAQAFASLVQRERSDIARLISQETGKPFWETLTEADSVAAKVAISIRAQDLRAGETITETAGLRQTLRHRPHGVLAVIGPFNFPMHLANGHIVPALLAGNAVVFKPSDKTPACGLYMLDLWRRAGLPDGVLQVAVGGAEAGAVLVDHDGIDGVLFTGGARAGGAIHRALSGRPGKILALELGGNNALVAWDVEDVEDAAHLIAQSAFISAGQRCSCARRLILPTGAAGDAIVDALAALTSRLRVGAAFDEPQPFHGPVIDNAAADTLLAAQAVFAAAGGKRIAPLARASPNRPLLRPGLIDMTEAGAVPDDEVFGPLLQIRRVAHFDTAVAAANDTRFGLAAGLIGGDEALNRQFWRGVRAGVVNWNRPTTGASSAAPFGGVGASGNHRPSAFYAADYCAWPVAGLESASATFRIDTGLSSREGANT
jgi:succinylglutamic semialdehyde dehydrogenase